MANQKRKKTKTKFFNHPQLLWEWTKNEKKHEGKGRFFPITNEIKLLLFELKELQNSLGIKSEYVFCTKEGDWITTRHYESALATVCKGLNLPKTNNHAIRMYLNSYIFIPAGIPVTDRAALLGHTVETNLKNYSFESTEYADEACKILNSLNSNKLGPKLDPKNLVYFPVQNNEKALKLNV